MLMSNKNSAPLLFLLWMPLGESSLMFSATKKLTYSDISVLRWHSWSLFLKALPPIFVIEDPNLSILWPVRSINVSSHQNALKGFLIPQTLQICHSLKSAIVSKYLVEVKKETKIYSTVSFLSWNPDHATDSFYLLLWAHSSTLHSAKTKVLLIPKFLKSFISLSKMNWGPI